MKVYKDNRNWIYQVQELLTKGTFAACYHKPETKETSWRRVIPWPIFESEAEAVKWLDEKAAERGMIQIEWKEARYLKKKE